MSSRSLTERVKSSLDIVQLIERTVSLHHETGEWYVGATSANSQSGASLKANSREQYYKNWATGDKGDCFNWIAFENNLDIVDDFPDILKIAAEAAGIPLEEASEEERTRAAEIHAVHDTLTQAAELYHENLTPQIRDYIHKKWGIHNETIDALKIGYASPDGRTLFKKINFNSLKAAGLLVKAGDFFTEFFQGRVVFPYWNRGQVVYFAARGDKTELGTPNIKYETAKYKKLLTHSEKREYVHESINNRYLFGEDTLRGQDYCVITEGIADAIVLIQNGFPVLSPVTTQFSDNDTEKLVSVAKRLKTVYICNDNEASGAGEKGAIKTGRLLKNVGVDVRFTTLPRPDGVDKIDVAEYFLTHKRDEFEEVLARSERLFTYLLKKIEKSQNKADNIEKAKQYIDEIVKSLPRDEADVIIDHEIKNWFGFTRDDCRILNRFYTRVQKEVKNETEMTVPKTASENEFEIPYDIVAERILDRVHIFTFDDTKEIYMYFGGVYKKERAETVLKNMAREIYGEIFCEMCGKEKLFTPDHLPVPGIAYVNEILEFIRIKTAVLRVEIDDCPEHKYLVNVKNGVYNVETGEFGSHNPELKLLRQLPINYYPTADCPQIRKFLNEVVKPEDAQAILEFLGYALIPDTRHDQAIMLVGNGSNGKSILLKITIALFGLKNICSTSLQRLCEDRFALSELYGKLLNVFPDLSDEGIRNDDAFKGLSSGDLLTAQQKYGQPFQFMNYARQIYSANDLPYVKKRNYSFFRRWILITFPYTFTEDPDTKKGEKLRDKNILEKLTTPEEMSGLFNLVVACLKHLLKNGRYTYAHTVEDVAEMYVLKSDPVKVFTDRYTEPGITDIPKTELYDAYKRWCSWKKAPILTSQRLTKRLKSLGFTECRPRDDWGNKTFSWGGVQLTEEFEDDVPTIILQKEITAEWKENEPMFWERWDVERNISQTVEKAHNTVENTREIGQSLDKLLNTDFSVSGDTNAEYLDKKIPIPVVCLEKLAPSGGETYMVTAPKNCVGEGMGINFVPPNPKRDNACVKNRDQGLSKVCPETVEILKVEDGVPKVKRFSQVDPVEHANPDESTFSRVKRLMLEFYNQKNSPVTDLREFVNGFLLRYPEFERRIVNDLAGMLETRGLICVYPNVNDCSEEGGPRVAVEEAVRILQEGEL